MDWWNMLQSSYLICVCVDRHVHGQLHKSCGEIWWVGTQARQGGSVFLHPPQYRQQRQWRIRNQTPQWILSELRGLQQHVHESHWSYSGQTQTSAERWYDGELFIWFGSVKCCEVNLIYPPGVCVPNVQAVFDGEELAFPWRHGGLELVRFGGVMLQLKSDNGYVLSFTPQSNEFTITMLDSSNSSYTAGLCGKTNNENTFFLNHTSTFHSLRKIQGFFFFQQFLCLSLLSSHAFLIPEEVVLKYLKNVII